jgi:hypothetical protein
LIPEEAKASRELQLRHPLAKSSVCPTCPVDALSNDPHRVPLPEPERQSDDAAEPEKDDRCRQNERSEAERGEESAEQQPQTTECSKASPPRRP